MAVGLIVATATAAVRRQPSSERRTAGAAAEVCAPPPAREHEADTAGGEFRKRNVSKKTIIRLFAKFEFKIKHLTFKLSHIFDIII